MTTIIKGYKSADNYIIELHIDTLVANNLNRIVIDKNHAKYRCKQACVVKIYNKFTNEEINYVKSDYNPSVIYKKGKYITIAEYDNDINKICTHGIHFYLTKEAAYFHNIDEKMILDGEYKIWFDNGLLCKRYNYVNGKKEGLYESFYDNGQILDRCNYINGKKEGLHEIWNNNGQIQKNVIM